MCIRDRAMDAEQTANEIDLERALAHRVAPHPLTEKMTQGLLDPMQHGPPFALTPDPQAKSVLHIDVRARLVRGDTGKVVYSTSLRCDIEAGDPLASARALDAVDHVREIERMP